LGAYATRFFDFLSLREYLVEHLFVAVGNPIGAGFVARLLHPGGNITGFTI
jgi:hypothetical protein